MSAGHPVASLSVEVEPLSDGTFIADAPWLEGAVYGTTFEEALWEALKRRPRKRKANR